ncbi:Glucoside xylosyltransferase 2 [Holothuria leucospilota]|uniref:UDP-D-xylose:beta-D-glucoside alpha-1,3-D-xylosyltransferase n=1 Tax=Holothuria leucospilota TaxID=206669 RepID=A0A9Q1CRI6_HOLLE|nr:Glucoside xylosyltransferase 2 [Holothuria leucospilota]
MGPYTSVKIFGFFILLVVLVVQFYFGSVALKQNPKKEGQEVLYRCQIRTSDDLTEKPVGCKKTKENRRNLFNTSTSWNDAGNNTNQVRSRKDRNKLYVTRTTDEFLKIPLQPDSLENVDIESCLDVFGNELLPLPEWTKCLVPLLVVSGIGRSFVIRNVKMRYLSNGTKYEVTMYIYNITYPSKENQGEWKDMFPQCTTQRLFIPDLLPKVDSVLYVDRDSLFISSPEKIWHFLSSFNSTQLAGVVAEHELSTIGWYNKQQIIPYYGKLGLNAGVILMNLTRMRNFKWSNRIIPLYWEYKSRLRLADQDLINLLFYFNPGMIICCLNCFTMVF